MFPRTKFVALRHFLTLTKEGEASEDLIRHVVEDRTLQSLVNMKSRGRSSKPKSKKTSAWMNSQCRQTFFL